MRLPVITARAWILASVIACIVGAWVVVLLQPERGGDSEPRGSITFLGYTNDFVGRRVVAFTVSNLSDRAVARAPHCVLETKPRGQNWKPQSAIPLSWPLRRAILAPNTSEIIAVAWRVLVFLSNDVGPTWTVKRLVNATFHLLGRSEPYGFATFQVDSQGIDPHGPH